MPADEEPEGAAAPEPVVTDEELADADEVAAVEPAAVEPEAAGADADDVAVLLAEWLPVVRAFEAECLWVRCFAPDAAVLGAGELPWLRSRISSTASPTAPRATAARVHRRRSGS